MKTSKTTLIYLTLLATLMLGAFTLQVSAPKPLTVNVTFYPDTINLEAPGWTTKLVNVTLWFDPGKYDARDIDPKTVLIEGVLGPKGGWKRTWTERAWEIKNNPWVLKFNVAGSSLIDLLWMIISHENIPGPVATIPLTVTGNLYETLGALPFTGTGYITVYMSGTTPPPPP